MMYENLVPGISQKIEKILKKEKLKPETSPIEFIRKTKGGKHRYSSICINSRGEKIVFYARIQKNKDAKKKVKKEALFARKLQDKNFRKKLLFSQFIPQYYKGKIEKDFEWLERKFIIENPLGNNESLKRVITKKGISETVDFLISLRKTKTSLLKNIPLGKFPLIDYKKSVHLLSFLQEKNIITTEESSKCKTFLKKYYPLFKQEHLYLSHGDFNLGNIIFTKDGLKVIDWESMEINNFAYDIAYLLTHLWEGKKWQRKELLNNYLSHLDKKEKNKFKILLRGNLFYLLGSGIFAKPKEIDKSLLPKRKRFFRNLFKASLKNFEKILTI